MSIFPLGLFMQVKTCRYASVFSLSRSDSCLGITLFAMSQNPYGDLVRYLRRGITMGPLQRLLQVISVKVHLYGTPNRGEDVNICRLQD